ncbi:pentapeptide repeat-containing protein [Pseudorhodoferax soli]|uniref:pentapeptide repeat-containing protein n=1 Tax=Pseudorhodoferax soli TaxID=545864 RepID=UPI001473DFE8|nr:pentapeptide repeat-containing protein [Pseudorhodoferax soli]
MARRAAIEHAARTGEALHFLSLDGMDLSEGHYEGLKLVNCSAVGVNWSGSKMAGASFDNCALSYSLFGRVKAHGAAFTTCDLSGSLWNGADATEAVFTAVNFRGVSARDLVAPRSRWSSVRTARADFRGADLAYADLRSVDDREVILAQSSMPEHIKAGTRCVAAGSSIENAQKFAAQFNPEAVA